MSEETEGQHGVQSRERVEGPVTKDTIIRLSTLIEEATSSSTKSSTEALIRSPKTMVINGKKATGTEKRIMILYYANKTSDEMGRVKIGVILNIIKPKNIRAQEAILYDTVYRLFRTPTGEITLERTAHDHILARDALLKEHQPITPAAKEYVKITLAMEARQKDHEVQRDMELTGASEQEVKELISDIESGMQKQSPTDSSRPSIKRLFGRKRD